jgi:4-amino-4-deoxychorismate lyase
MGRSLKDLFGIKGDVHLEKIIDVPQNALKGVYKCRVIYDEKNVEIEFIPYVLRPVRSLRLVNDDNISYSYKFTDRTKIERLSELRGGCDDILIIKNGMVTDTSFANVIFMDINGNWVTPSTCLLKGTRRFNLLNNRIITEKDIHVYDLKHYIEIKLINAMIGIEDSEKIKITDLRDSPL